MRRISAGTPLAEPVAEFIHSSTWVDLQRVFNESWITGESTGLKTIAPLAGYEWPLHAPGGRLSIVRHTQATTKAPDLDARTGSSPTTGATSNHAGHPRVARY